MKHYDAIVLVPQVVQFRTDVVGPALTDVAHGVVAQMPKIGDYQSKLLEVKPHDKEVPAPCPYVA